jgi:hypothetical protein
MQQRAVEAFGLHAARQKRRLHPFVALDRRWFVAAIPVDGRRAGFFDTVRRAACCVGPRRMMSRAPRSRSCSSRLVERMVQPPSRRAAERPIAFFVGRPDVDRDHVAAVDGAPQRRLIGDAKILAEPDDGYS